MSGQNAWIVDCVRTPAGKNRGALSKYHPADLGAVVVDALVARNKIDPALIEDVIFGCVSQVGSQSGNLARGVVLSSVLPESVPGTTVDRQCGSSQQAIHFAAQAVLSGTQDVVIAGGVEVMSLVPIGASVMDGVANGRGQPMSNNMQKRYPGVAFSQFDGAEMLAVKYDIERKEMDAFAVASHKKANEAQKSGRFQKEIVPLKGVDKSGKEIDFTADEGVRWPSTIEKISSLPLLRDGGRLSAASASQISDGAAALLICNDAGLKKLGLKPRARIVSLALAGDDPVVMLSGPIPATKTVLQKSGLSIKDIDLYEVNEAFASVPLAWAKALNADINKLNVNGGAMALGHPLGATGAKLMTTLVNELERTGGRYGLQAICEGGGTANATIIERVGAIPSKL